MTGIFTNFSAAPPNTTQVWLSVWFALFSCIKRQQYTIKVGKDVEMGEWIYVC